MKSDFRGSRSEEGALQLPATRQLSAIIPKADAESGQHRGAKSRRFRCRRPLHGDTDEIRLQLHKQIARRRAAVHAKLRQRVTGIALHRHQHIGDLESDAFESGACNVGSS